MIKKKLIFLIFIILLFNLTSGFFIKIKNSYSQTQKNESDKKDKSNNKLLKEAMFYKKLDKKRVQCNLCPRRCVIEDGQVGFCRVRQNIEGTLYSLNYGRIAAMNVDPIEKKPFFHFLPGTKSFSIACAGCNLRCKYCQNWEISQRGVAETDPYIEPEKVVELALKSGSKSIAYTYSEPIVFYEYLIDTAKLAKEKGLKNVVVTAGYINKEPLEYMLKYIDGVKVDLKGFSNENFYLKYTSGKIQPVLETIKTIKKSGRWLEIVNLIIPQANDDEKDIKALCKWIKENIGDDVPLHFTRFYPNYQMQNTPPTPQTTIINARKIALDMGLKYVYTGNIYFPEGEATYCNDGSIAFERRGFLLVKNNTQKGICKDGTKIKGVFE